MPAVAPAPQAAEPTRTDGTPGPAEEASAAHGETTPRGPAISSARLRSRAPGLADSYRAAGAALRKHGLAGTRAKVYLVLDRSASMRPYYKDGSTQALAERTLALAAQVDPGATVRVVFFSTEVDGVGELTLRDHEGVIERLHTGLGRMGRTNYHAAVTEVIALHGKSDDPAAPALVVFQTDGAPDARTPATKALAQAAADHPKVFFSFVAFGDPRGKASDYLRRLGTGNTGYFLAGESPREVPDKDLYTAVLAAWRP
ncbi:MULTISPECIES: VWA domain-containing protein [unclassified Streptomyces]|uniref:VWA domain-containing protein n=1 Tax=unclassified Streptomyces TaxID=2593676 RepID=UPI001F5B8032|nr:VWA domain-containing protein [Streptomyces sp. HSG2]